MHLLHIEGSPRKQRSASIDVAHAFIDAWKQRHADGSVDTLDGKPLRYGKAEDGFANPYFIARGLA